MSLLLLFGNDGGPAPPAPTGQGSSAIPGSAFTPSAFDLSAFAGSGF